MPKTKLKPPMTPPELEAYYNAPEILAPPERKALVRDTRGKEAEILALLNNEFDGDACA